MSIYKRNFIDLDVLSFLVEVFALVHFSFVQCLSKCIDSKLLVENPEKLKTSLC